MAYRRLPEAAMDDPEAACRWARTGIAAAMRKAAAKKSKTKKTPAANKTPAG
jgi:TfoX/Sxy family transcriptional regulator of competence genes